MDNRDAAAGTAPAIDMSIEAGGWPPEEALGELARRAVAAASAVTEMDTPHTLGILFTADGEIRALNARFRGKDKPTNVLSFPATANAGLPGELPHLGDIALAYETVVREARAEGKPFDHHLSHLIVHGFLHLVGYDHETDREAEEMEELERAVLKGLAIADPYA